MPENRVAKKQKVMPKEQVWPVVEGEKLMLKGNPNNLLLRSAKLEARGDFDGAVEAIEKAIKKNPKKTPLTSYLGDLLRRKRIYETGTDENLQEEVSQVTV
jgi:tetratricopeptide (TPR) repeat protein